MTDWSESDGAADNLELSKAVEHAEALSDTLQDASKAFSRTLVTGMKSAVLEGRTLDSILQSAAKSIISSAFRAGIAPLANLVTQGAGGLFGSLAGATKLLPFAKGGVIGTPTTFPLTNRAAGLMGEAGREAILPLARGADGALGVAAHGGAGGTTPVVVNIATADVESFRRSEAQVTAMLARAVTRGRRGL